MKPATMAFMQVGLALAVLLVATLSPRDGKPVLLVPIAGHAAAQLRPLAATGLSLVGSGRLPGSIVVYHSEKFPVLAVLRLGFLPLAAPAGLCRSQTRGS